MRPRVVAYARMRSLCCAELGLTASCSIVSGVYGSERTLQLVQHATISLNCKQMQMTHGSSMVHVPATLQASVAKHQQLRGVSSPDTNCVRAHHDLGQVFRRWASTPVAVYCGNARIAWQGVEGECVELQQA